MIKSYKTIVALIALIFISFSFFAEDLLCTTKNGSLYIDYTPSTHQGDVISVKLTARKEARSTSASCNLTDAKASIVRIGNTKSPASASCYALKNRKNTYICLLPIDSMLKEGDFNLKISGNFDGKNFSKEYPLSILKKDFLSETIELNESNTAIKTNTSEKRMAQIDKLNKILFSINNDSQFAEGNFTFPVTSKRRTAFFGDRRVYAYSNGKSSTSVHNGHDYGIPTGTVISACADGKVVMAEDRISTGWSIVIEHMPGLYSLYYHMSKLEVEVGQTVKQGERLGLSGATGLATGPHLHWEVRLLGVAIDPDFFVTNRLY